MATESYYYITCGPEFTHVLLFISPYKLKQIFWESENISELILLM